MDLIVNGKVLPYCSVFNPNPYPVKVYTYTFRIPHGIRDITVVIPPRSWRMLYISNDVEIKIARYGLQCMGCGNIPNPPPQEPPPDVDDPEKIKYEDLIVITSAVLADGYFELDKEIPPYHWDSTEFVPDGAPDQIYGNDYTIKNWDDKSHVIFNSNIADGPTVGMQAILTAGDRISFRYLIV